MKCNKQTLEIAVKLKRKGAINVDIIKACNITESTFYRWVNQPSNARERAFSEAIKSAELDYKTYLTDKILAAAEQRDWKAAAWLLERKYPMEYSLAPKRFEDIQRAGTDTDTDPLSEALEGLAKGLENE